MSKLLIKNKITGEWEAIPYIIGPQGPKGEDGKNGITPHIGENGNWYIGETDTGIPSRGEDASQESILYTPQDLTPEQQTQARENIGAIPAPETAEVGQTIVVKEVNENGKPILWEAAVLPFGGSGSFNDNPLELINEITLEEDVHDVIFNTEADGTPLELEDFYVQVQAKSTTDDTLGHTTVNGVFLQNFGFTVSNTTDFSEYTVTYFLNVGQAIIKGKRSGVGQVFSSSSIAAMVVNRPITTIRFQMAAARVDIQSGSNFKLYGRRVKK